MSLIIPFSEACERNKDAIYEVIKPYLENANSVLEIGSGTGQHAMYFAQLEPELVWQPTDQLVNLPGLKAQFSNQPVSNLAPVQELAVETDPWFDKPRQFDVVYSANTLHIMPWPHVEALFNNITHVTHDRTILIIYGPFLIDGKYTSGSNRDFDLSLRSRGQGSGLRDLESVDHLAQQANFQMIHNHTMPANNQCVIWQQQGVDQRS